MEIRKEKTEMENLYEGSDSSSESNKTIEREKWSRKTDYMLSMLGYAVGLGNLWRFPYLCMRNGGVGLPLYFLETALGQFTGKSTLLSWECENDWNTEACIADRTVDTSDMGTNVSLYLNGTFSNDRTVYNQTTSNSSHTDGTTSEEEFWQYNVLRLSSGLSNIGGISWHLVASSFGAWLLVYFCVIKGVKSVGKVVYVTAVMPYILLTVLLVRGLTLPGSLDGIIFYLKPDFEKLLSPQVWVEAALQVFYSLGPCWGPLITMSSFNKFTNNCFRDSILLTFASEGTSIYGGFVVFAILGFMAQKANLPISEVVKSGPGLGFVAYPEALAQLPLPNLWAVLFFLMLLTEKTDSVFCSGLWDRISTRLGYMYPGAEMFSRDIKMMLGREVPVIIRICWCILTPFFLLMILLFTIITYKPPTYGSYHYPPYARALGWVIALVSVIPIPWFMASEIRKAEGYSITEKFRNALRPSKRYGPICDIEDRSYRKEDRVYH
ncbi:hypothetical protein KUTeg_021800, partial [Tegillarca granosa]